MYRRKVIRKCLQFIIIIIIITKTFNVHISTLLGVQGAVKPKTKRKKTDTTELVFENRHYIKISFKKRLNFAIQRQDLRLSGRELQMHGEA